MAVLAGEAQRTEELDGVVDVLARVLREVRPEGISVTHAQDVRNRAIAIEKAAASLKLLVAGRAAHGQGENTAATELAEQTGTSVTRAKALLGSSKQITDQPAVEDAVRAGQLSEDQTTAITDAVEKNPAAAPKLLDEAKQGSLRNLKDACGKAKADADPDEEATHRRNHAMRSFRTTTDTDQSFLGFLRSTTRVEFMANFEPFRRAIFDRNRAAGIHDPHEAMDHDALIEMARTAHRNLKGTAGGEPGPDRPGDGGSGGGGAAVVKPPTTVYVVVDFDRLVETGRHGSESAFVAGLGQVPTSVVREILENAFLVGVVMHGTEVAKIKRWGRHIPVEVRDALMIKHRFRCSTPGCGNWARIEIDHLHPRAKGGETSYANCDPKCDDCHDQKSAQDRLIWDDIPYRDSS